jgi:TM2 domain-containing membrane protein YozV
MRKNNITAGLLAMFCFGCVGSHWFYLNQTGKGITYLILSLTIVGLFITPILAFIDAITLLTMDEKVFNYKYNNENLNH